MESLLSPGVNGIYYICFSSSLNRVQVYNPPPQAKIPTFDGDGLQRGLDSLGALPKPTANPLKPQHCSQNGGDALPSAMPQFPQLHRQAGWGCPRPIAATWSGPGPKMRQDAGKSVPRSQCKQEGRLPLRILLLLPSFLG